MEAKGSTALYIAAAGAAAVAAWALWSRSRKQRGGGKLLVSEPSLTALEEKYLRHAYKSTFISGGAGSYKARLEKEFAAMCGCTYGVATANGTVALNLAMHAVGMQRGVGDEIIVPSMTYVATAAAVVDAGGTPVFCDCDSLGLIDPAAIELAITAKTKAIIVVHLYGHIADMDPILRIANQRGIAVIEDAAEAHGATYKGRKAGSFGDVATFSFYANKVMTTGEGGIIVTNRKDLHKQMVYLRGHAMSPDRRFWHTDVGFNYRLSNLLCAVGVAQLERFSELFNGRKRVIEAYARALEGYKGVKINIRAANCEPSPWLACVWLPEGSPTSLRDQICLDLEERGIETRPFFYPVHTMPPYTSFRFHSADPRPEHLKNTMTVAARGFNIPTSVGLTNSEIRFVSNAVKEVLGQHC
mmetsp:Transcript_29510/g.57762  ORF Transcript_29510/g.57762 Transcript_29510/m.57762 type:complete len:414 (+) Transcript_29510:43-1284(+)